nr:PilC/PilY family type IV pilus protein [uncultured Methylotenera sp.]
MKNYIQSLLTSFSIAGLLVLGGGLPLSVHAATVDLATVPLANATTTNVLPNLMFILDNSGSMGQDYTPDYISDIFNSPATNDKNCRDSGDDGTTGSSGTLGDVFPGVVSGATRVLDMCVVGDVPFMNSDMNSQYYNPAIRYTPGVNADGTSRGDQTTFTNVRTDSYNKQNTTQLLTSSNYVDLTTSYPDRVWCTKQNPTASELTNTSVCRKNSDYLYPNATFKYGRTSGVPDQQMTASMLTNVIKVSGAPYYYSVVPTEYCSEAELVNCVLSSTPTTVSGVSYSFPAKSRWCSNTTLTTCKSTRSGSYVYPRYVGATVTGVAAVGSFVISGAGSGTTTVGSVKVNNIEIMGGTGAGCGTASSTSTGGTNARRIALADAIVAKINSCVSNPEYTAVSDGANSPKITITSTVAAGANGNGTVQVSSLTNSASIGTIVNAAGGVTSFTTPPYTFTRTDITSLNDSYPKSAARTDCGATCSYVQEMTNFANWYTYYRTRMQAMKTAASLAFKPIDNRYRVGFITIANQSSNYLPINKFDAGTGSQKEQWYTKLFGITPSSSTPLRSALSLVGRIYAGKNPVGSSDPVQYSCQQNFALLTTDGYWNTDANTDVKDVAGTGQVGNKDASPTVRPMYEGQTASTNSLADVAKYYYDTDLRTTTLGNCTGALGLDVCENNVFVSGTDNNPQQHMTTFTLGLGVDGALMYSSDYKTATSGDFYNLKNGLGSPTVDWPVPVADTETAVDDLWHAAVNGQGTYFSAKDPSQLTKGLTEALSQINAKIGAGAAAATSTLNPVAGDNFAYLASYTTVKWTGNLEKRTINTTTGEVSESAVWCAEDVVTASCAAPSSIVAEPSGSSSIYYCVTPNASSCTAGTMDGTNCKVEVQAACRGTMADKIASGTRRVLMNSSGALANFTYANMTPVQQSYFQQTYLAPKLSQWTSLDAVTQQPNAKEANLVNFLRGDTTYEDRGTNTPVNRLFRYREAFLGDALESSPVFVGAPVFKYSENNYPNGIDVNRARTVYIGTNDGMLHAFDADTGKERWAYVPSMVIPNMWKLADKNYSTMHANYVNGDPIVSDVYDGSTWRTILVGGLNGGGKGYYALDITNPDSPILLWEFGNTDCVGCTRSDNNMGYSFGNPVITKTPENKWVVVLTSGYNNGGGSESGKGVLYVLNALTGTTLISNISTGVGDNVTPSGLAEISAWSDVADAEKENVAHWIYGGDLLGNLWRFDIGATPSTPNPKLVAILKDSQGNRQPITTRPELGKVGDNRVVFVGTGKYLEISDLTTKQQQTLYAIKDSNGPTIDNPRNTLVEQTLSAPSNTRTGSTNSVDMTNGDGWFVNFYVPAASDTTTAAERQNVAGQLVAGTLLVPTTIPSNAVCSPGGYSYLNYFSYDTGKPPNLSTGLVSTKTNAPIVGFNVVYIAGKPVVSAVTADAKFEPVTTEFSGGNAKFQSKRAIWRELLD